MRKYLILFAMLAVVLSACRIESNVILDIEEDGSAVVGAEIGFDEEFRELLGDMGEGSPEDLFGELPDFGGENVQPTERTEGDMTFYGVTTTVEDLSTFDTSAAGGEAFETFSYVFDEDTATLSATVAAADLGDAGGDLPIDPSQITDEFFSANVLVTMPGTVTSHDADEVRSDGTLVWTIPFTGSKTISATSDLGSGGSSNLILIALVALSGDRGHHRSGCLDHESSPIPSGCRRSSRLPFHRDRGHGDGCRGWTRGTRGVRCGTRGFDRGTSRGHARG